MAMLSPSGFVYCKECIFANLLRQKQQVKRDTELYDQQLLRDAVRRAHAAPIQYGTSSRGCACRR